MTPSMRRAIVMIFALVVAAATGLCATFQYESHGKRDPLVPLIGSERPAIGKLEDVTAYTDVRLEGIASGSGGKMVAIVNGQVVREGEKHGEVEVRKISKASIMILFGKKEYEINLSEAEGGAKSGQ